MSWNKDLPVAATHVDDSVTQILANWVVINTMCLCGHSKMGADSVQHSAGEVSVFAVAPAATLAALTPVPCAFAWDTTHRTLITWTDVASSNRGGFVPSGTKMLFYEAAAPAGWTIDLDVNEKLAYITKGSAGGGVVGGAEVAGGTWTLAGISVDSHTITEAELPVHTHSYTQLSGTTVYSHSGAPNLMSQTTSYTDYVGGGGGHTHTVGMNDQWRPSAYNCILCTKA